MTEGFSKFSHVGVVVTDIEASIAWYMEHLGFERMYGFSFPGVKAEFVRRGELRIEFFQAEGASPMAQERQKGEENIKIGGINHFAIEVADLDQTVADLEDKGVELVSPPRDVPGGQGERFAFIHDNEKMLIELFQPKNVP